MGLLSQIALLPLAPVRSVAWVTDQLVAEAERVADPRDRIRAELRDLADALERGEITEEEYDRREEPLLRQLAAVSQPYDEEDLT